MWGRYARRGDKQKIAETFHTKDLPDADYNVVMPNENLTQLRDGPVAPADCFCGFGK